MTIETATPSIAICESCKKEYARADCKYVVESRFIDGRFKNITLLVCAEKCAPFYITRQALRTTKNRFHTQHRRPQW